MIPVRPGSVRRSRPGGRVIRTLAAGQIAATLAWFVIYWMSPSVWWMDVIASFAVQAGFVLVCLGAMIALLGQGWRRLAAGSAGIAVLAVVLPGRSLWVTGPDSEGGSIRLLELNVGMTNREPEAVLGFINSSGADVVVVIEPVWSLFVELFLNDALGDPFLYREWRQRSGDKTSPLVVLSRWPMVRLDGLEDLSGVGVEIDGSAGDAGRFTLIAMHPSSPRNRDRWVWGNARVERVGLFARDLAGPVVVVADLNGGPLSWRDRRLRSLSGLRRSKPFLEPATTYSSRVPMFGAAIDDVWIGRAHRVAAWDTVRVPGSDHMGVEVTLYRRVPNVESGSVLEDTE